MFFSQNIVGRECQYFEAVHSESKPSKCIHNPLAGWWGSNLVFRCQLLLLQDLKWFTPLWSAEGKSSSALAWRWCLWDFASEGEKMDCWGLLWTSHSFPFGPTMGLSGSVRHPRELPLLSEPVILLRKVSIVSLSFFFSEAVPDNNYLYINISIYNLTIKEWKD